MSEELRKVLKVFSEEGVGIDHVEVVMNLGAVYQPVPGPTPGGNGGNEPPVEPPVDDKIMHTIKPKSNGSFPVYRTADLNEINKIRLVLVSDQQVEEREPPKKIHNSRVWDTTADLHNIMRDWAWLPRQDVVQAANNKMVQIPFFYLDDGGPIWQGCFVERKYLK